MLAVCTFFIVTFVAWVAVSAIFRLDILPIRDACVFDTDVFVLGATLQAIVPLTAGGIVYWALLRGETLFAALILSLFWSLMAGFFTGMFCSAILGFFRPSDFLIDLGYSLRGIYELPYELACWLKRFVVPPPAPALSVTAEFLRSLGANPTGEEVNGLPLTDCSELLLNMTYEWGDQEARDSAQKFLDSVAKMCRAYAIRQGCPQELILLCVAYIGDGEPPNETPVPPAPESMRALRYVGQALERAGLSPQIHLVWEGEGQSRIGTHRLTVRW